MIFSIEDSCMDRRSDNHDEKTFERIVAAYRKSKAVQMRSASVYQVATNGFLSIQNTWAASWTYWPEGIWSS